MGTPQYRSVTGLGDALNDSTEMKVIFLALNANLEMIDGQEVCLENIIDKMQELCIRAIKIPMIENRIIRMYSVKDRKANIAGEFCASFKTELLDDKFTDVNIFIGDNKRGINKFDSGINLLNGKSSKEADEWFGEILSTLGHGKVSSNVFMKFINDVKIIINGTEEEKEGILSGGENQDFDICSTQFKEYVLDTQIDQSDLTPIGKPIPTVQGLECATGQAIFTEDMPRLQDELFFGLVTSSISHGEIISIDTSDALKIPGVVRFIGFNDVPPGKNTLKFIDIPDEVVFVEKIVLC